MCSVGAASLNTCHRFLVILRINHGYSTETLMGYRQCCDGRKMRGGARGRIDLSGVGSRPSLRGGVSLSRADM